MFLATLCVLYIKFTTQYTEPFEPIWFLQVVLRWRAVAIWRRDFRARYQHFRAGCKRRALRSAFNTWQRFVPYSQCMAAASVALAQAFKLPTTADMLRKWRDWMVLNK